MAFKNYIDACRQLAEWCQQEAQACESPGERLLWLDAAAYWREHTAMAEGRSRTEKGADRVPRSGRHDPR
jgi:hypothetical protein